MSPRHLALHVGDHVIHPRYGFGIVESVLAYDRDGASVEYYQVQLADRGTLSVPVTGAAALGLRRLVNGVSATLAMLRAGAGSLPEHPRHRGIELASRWTSPEPAALAGGVRDLLGRARVFGLKGADLKWLNRACDRLVKEAARVDRITPESARVTLTEEVTRLQTPPPAAEPSKPTQGAAALKRAQAALPAKLAPKRRPLAR